MKSAARKQKRSDIQGLRAVAIIGVLLFHLAPKRFVNGFLGVDTFFVLSGYLMSTILSRESSLNWQTVCSFYARRFKRIVPLYTCMLIFVTIITPLIFLPSDISHFVTDLEWALPLAENMQNVLKKYDYWAEIFSYPVLLHAWSLGVEIQYYLLVPFIMTVARLAPNRMFRAATYSVLFGVSLLIHLLSPKVVSFGLLFARIWQFLAGSIVFELEDALDEPSQYQPVALGPGDKNALLDYDDDMESLSDADTRDDLNESPSGCDDSLAPLIVLNSYALSIFLIWTLTFSSWGSTLQRFLILIATSILLIIGKYKPVWVLSTPIMIYIGDLSYVIYLTHWPVIVLYKYYYDLFDLNLADIAVCLFVTLIISVFLHHTLECFFIASSTKVSLVFVGLIYVTIIVLLLIGGAQKLSEFSHPSNNSDISVTTPTSVNSRHSTQQMPTFDRKEAIDWNLAQSKLCYFGRPADCVKDVEAEKWTKFYEEDYLRCLATGKGTAKVLVIGNSYGYRAFPALYRLFAGRYSQMRMFTRSVRTYLTIDTQSSHFADMEKLVVEKFQPDITFIIELDTWGLLASPIVGDVEDDAVTKFLHHQVDVLCNNSGTVVVEQQYLKTPWKQGVAYLIQKGLQQGKSNFDDLSAPRKEYERTFASEIIRISTLRNKPNVVIHDAQRGLCPGEHCYFFNRTNLHSFFGDAGCHLTSEGLRMLEPKYKEIIEDFLRRHTEERKNFAKRR